HFGRRYTVLLRPLRACMPFDPWSGIPFADPGQRVLHERIPVSGNERTERNLFGGLYVPKLQLDTNAVRRRKQPAAEDVLDILHHGHLPPLNTPQRRPPTLGHISGRSRSVDEATPVDAVEEAQRIDTAEDP